MFCIRKIHCKTKKKKKTHAKRPTMITFSLYSYMLCFYMLATIKLFTLDKMFFEKKKKVYTQVWYFPHIGKEMVQFVDMFGIYCPSHSGVHDNSKNYSSVYLKSDLQPNSAMLSHKSIDSFGYLQSTSSSMRTTPDRVLFK